LDRQETDKNYPVILEVHSLGINIRHLGHVRVHLLNKYWKTVLLLEMIARVVKNDLKKDLREKMHVLQQPGIDPFV
jgi:hypothetical protein